MKTHVLTKLAKAVYFLLFAAGFTIIPSSTAAEYLTGSGLTMSELSSLGDYEKITEKEVRLLDDNDPKLLLLYIIAMPENTYFCGPGKNDPPKPPNLPWQTAIRKDLAIRPAVGGILASCFEQPNKRRFLPNIVDWLILNPDHPAKQFILDKATQVFRETGFKDGANNARALGHFIAVLGKLEDRWILEQLNKEGLLSPDSMTTFQRRLRLDQFAYITDELQAKVDREQAELQSMPHPKTWTPAQLKRANELAASIDAFYEPGREPQPTNGSWLASASIGVAALLMSLAFWAFRSRLFRSSKV